MNTATHTLLLPALCRPVGLACAVLCCAMAAQAQSLPSAPTAQPAAAVPAEPLRLRGFEVTGDNPLDDAATTLALAPYLRAEVSMDTLQKATAALEAALSAHGFALHRVVLPAQEVSDKLHLQVVRFAIGRVTVEGAGDFGEPNIRRSLPALQEDATPNLKTLAVQTALANENPAKRLQVALRGSDDNPDLIDATVRVQASPPVTGAVSLSNTGNASSGHDRFNVTLGHANLWGLDHQIFAAFTTSLARFEDVRQWGLSYRLPVYSTGSMLDVSLTRASVLGQFGSFTSTGAGHTAAWQFTQHLGTEGGLTRHLTLGVDDKVFDPTSVRPTASGPVFVLSQQRRSRPLSLGLKVQQQSDSAYGDAHLTWAANLPGGRGNNIVAYQSENPALTSSRWVALRWGSSRISQAPGGWLVGWRWQGQWASTGLIAGEQFGLGGVGSLRGADDRVLAAESGMGYGLEFTTPLLASGLRAVAFADAGWVRRKASAHVDKLRNDSATSLGLGLRYATGPLAVSLDYARVVRGSRQAGTAPQTGEEKLHLMLSARF